MTNYFPPEKGEGRGFLLYRQSLTKLARENRHDPSPAEKRIWFEVLSGKRLDGYKFLRQKPIGEHIVDFYCSELRLALEVDGDTHAERKEYDRRRTRLLADMGVAVIRYGRFYKPQSSAHKAARNVALRRLDEPEIRFLELPIC